MKDFFHEAISQWFCKQCKVLTLSEYCTGKVTGIYCMYLCARICTGVEVFTGQSLIFNHSTMAQVKLKEHIPPSQKTQQNLLVVFCSGAPVQNGFLSHATGSLEVRIDL